MSELPKRTMLKSSRNRVTLCLESNKPIRPSIMKPRSHLASRRVAIFSNKSVHYAADTCAPLSIAVAKGEVSLHALAHGAYPGRLLPSGMLTGVSSVGYWNATYPQNWGLDWHRNEGIEITFLEQGLLSFGIADESIDLKPGMLTVTRPWQPHRVGNPNVKASRLHWLILDLDVRRPNQPWRWPPWLTLAPEDLRNLTQLLRQNEHATWLADHEIRDCWRRIACAVDVENVASMHSRLRVAINELLLLLAEMLTRDQPKLDPSLTSSERTVELFLTELQHNAAQRCRSWTILEMSECCGLGVTHFVNLCRQITNRTPAQYLLWCRLEAAREMLTQQPTIPVTEVAFACGFSSSQYFSTAFRREIGTSPMSIRHALDARP